MTIRIQVAYHTHPGCGPYISRLRVSAQYSNVYNEVLVDSKVYVQNLPHSVAAFYFGLIPGEEDDRWARVHATQMCAA